MSTDDQPSNFRNIMWFFIGLTCGAGALFYMDPKHGRRRRKQTVEKAQSLSRRGWTEVKRSTKRVQNKISGVTSQILHPTAAQIDDSTLAARVRAALGHHVHHAHSIQTEVHNGVVTLSGPVSLKEVDELLDCVHKVRGVRQVISQLDVENPPRKGYLQ